MSKRCFDCVFCETTQLPFADSCAIDDHDINDVYKDVCPEFINGMDPNIKDDYATLLDKKRKKIFKDYKTTVFSSSESDQHKLK